MWHVEQEERIIAPVPDKAEGLKDEFVKAVYETAETLIAQADRIAVIGYSFNPHDHASYNRLVRVAKGRSVLVVAPDADDSIDRLRSKYPEIRWVGQSLTFKNWVGRGYPGLEC
jgi:hypothetical protein